MFEPWPDEPDETEVEQRWGNPERDLPRVPEVSTGEMDADPQVAQAFWVSVLFANAAVFGVSLGAMLWYFRGQALLGGVLIGAGLLAGLRTYASYREFKRGDSADEDEDRDGENTADGATDDAVEAESDATDDSDTGTVTATSPADTDTDATAADTTADAAERNG